MLLLSLTVYRNLFLFHFLFPFSSPTLNFLLPCFLFLLFVCRRQFQVVFPRVAYIFTTMTIPTTTMLLRCIYDFIQHLPFASLLLIFLSPPSYNLVFFFFFFLTCETQRIGNVGNFLRLNFHWPFFLSYHSRIIEEGWMSLVWYHCRRATFALYWVIEYVLKWFFF